MTGYRVHAALHLLSIGDGGLAAAMPSGTRSLLVRFPAAGPDNEPVMFGAVWAPIDGGTLAAGADVEVEVLFWADEARIHATAGASLEVWYAGRVVGAGTITDVVDELGQP